ERSRLRLFDIGFDGDGVDRRAEEAYACRRVADGADQVFLCATFENIACGPDLESFRDEGFVAVHGEDDHAGCRGALAEDSHRLKSAQAWHHQVKHQHVRLGTLHQANGLQAVTSLADDGEVWV